MTGQGQLRTPGERLLVALVTNRRTSDDIEIVWAAAQSWLQSGCTQPMHRFLPVPPSPAKLTEAARNIWIKKAALLVIPAATKPTVQARMLHQALNTFVTRGPWQVWRDQQCPPVDASQLRTALFYATKFNDGKILGERQIYRVLT